MAPMNGHRAGARGTKACVALRPSVHDTCYGCFSPPPFAAGCGLRRRKRFGSKCQEGSGFAVGLASSGSGSAPPNGGITGIFGGSMCARLSSSGKSRQSSLWAMVERSPSICMITRFGFRSFVSCAGSNGILCSFSPSLFPCSWSVFEWAKPEVYPKDSS
jgi:hypothetical protein